MEALLQPQVDADAAYSATATSRSAARTAGKPVVRRSRKTRSSFPSRTRTERIAARRKASVPGWTRRWRSAIAADSVRFGSITTSRLAGSAAILFSVSRAFRIPCACQGFVPIRRTSSASSTASVTWQVCRPKSRPFTQKSPVFSWASAE